MALRVTIDQKADLDTAWLDLGGPILMIAALVGAAWFSRSLIPSGMAMLIGLILMPELKDRMLQAFPHLGWGTGLGSSLAALGLSLGSFVLRRLPALRNLGDGDRYMGESPYPLRRLDHTLFTWPMLATAFFLAVRVELWTFFVNVEHDVFSGSSQTATALRVTAALLVSGAVWTLLGVYHRERRLAHVATFIGLIWMIVAVAFTCPQVSRGADAALCALAAAILVQALFFFYRFGLQPRHAWAGAVLATPARWILRLASIGFVLPVVGASMLGSNLPDSFWALAAFTAVQLAWHGLASRGQIFGFALFAVDWATLLGLAGRNQGLIPSTSLMVTLGLVIFAQALQAGLEFRKPFYEFLKPLMLPFQICASFVAVCAGLFVLASIGGYFSASTMECALLLVALLLCARALTSGPVALLAVLVGYVLVESGTLGAPQSSGASRWTHLVEPLRASFLGFTMAVLGYSGQRIQQNHPTLLSGAFRPRKMKWPVVPWMFFPAALLACTAAFYHTADPALREFRDQLWAPYVGAATIGVIAFSTGLLPVYHGAGALLTLGNVHLVRVVLGGLRDRGLSEIHLIALGIALTLLEGSAIRLLVRKGEIVRLVNRASLAWGGLILLLISANYLVHPDLAAITPARFAVSGAMSLLAGWYFRRCARRPAPGEEPFAIWCEGFYHFGVTMAFWCAALMIPALRSPITALVSLGLPVLYFYARAESGFRRGAETFVRYRISAATLGFIVLALYVFRGVVQMVIFPEAKFDTVYYHANSPVIFVLGLVLLRLHALGGTSWLAFYGGLAVMGSTYFALTALPGLSPFTHPVASAWCAIAMAHFYTIASIQQSPIRTAIRRLSGVDVQEWLALRRPWGVCLLGAAHAMALWGILDYGRNPLMVAPLILGAASVLVHQGILRQSRLYPLTAQVEVALALHMGFLLQSYLPKQHVVWALLGLWAAILAAQPMISRLVGRWEMRGHAAILAGLTLAQVFYHHSGSPAGLWAFALAAVLVSLTPRATRSAESLWELLSAAALPWAPAWLVWFSLAPLEKEGLEGAFHSWPALATAATLFATGALASLLQKGWATEYLGAARLRPRLFDQTVAWLGSAGATVYSVLLWITFLVALFVQGAHWGQRFGVKDLILLEGLYAAFAVAWIFEGQAHKSMAPYFLMEACVLAAYIGARQQFVLTPEAWKYEYDVWASLAAFFGFVGAKQILDRQPREILIPLKSALLALPMFSVTWVALHHLAADSTDMGLMVVGLHSAAFAYMGKDDRESPYHLVAIGGFVAFILMAFWSKLQLPFVYAYVVPVGVGVLILLQLFRERVPLEARNVVRGVTVLAMLASAGWSALLDLRLPLLHNLALVLLCLGAMGLGGLLRIRLYTALGFGALMIDLGVLLVKAVGHMERSLRMTVVGTMVLVVGAALVFGAIYYKTHRAEIGERLGRWRLHFSGWE
jgi:hypothetical protein